LYFENDYPKPKGSVNYVPLYTEYTSDGTRNKYNSEPNAAATSSFFDTVVTPNFKVAEQFCIELAKILETNKDNPGTITLNIDPSISILIWYFFPDTQSTPLVPSGYPTLKPRISVALGLSILLDVKAKLR
jgi:hypothetical protein